MAGYRSYRDGTYQSTTTQPPTTVSGLSCGSAYTFEVDAFDADGQRIQPRVGDRLHARLPRHAGSLGTRGRRGELAHGDEHCAHLVASTDNVGVVGYGLYRGGSAAGTSSSTTGIFSGLTCNTNYTLAVDAYDAAGNRSAKTTVMVSTTACPDTHAAVDSDRARRLERHPDRAHPQLERRPPTTSASRATTSTATARRWHRRDDERFSGLACGTSYTFAVEAFDAAGNRSTKTTVTVATTACSPPPPPGLGVDRATMLATGGTVLRSDTSAVANLQQGLWGIHMANTTDPGAPWYVYQTTGGSSHLKADGTAQGNTAYRQLTRLNTDAGWNRSQIGRDWSAGGENTGTQTNGAFALYSDGERKITFLSMRFPSATYNMNLNGWQQILQIKQAQPYTGSTPPAPTIEVHLYNGLVRLDSLGGDLDDSCPTSRPVDSLRSRRDFLS